MRGFIAVNYRIHVYVLDNISSSFKNPWKTLASPRAINTGGGAESVSKSTCNIDGDLTQL